MVSCLPLKFNTYAAKTGYQEPSSAEDGPYQDAYGTPQLLRIFAGKPSFWTPIQLPHGRLQSRQTELDGRRIFPGPGKTDQWCQTRTYCCFLVDIGGSVGHDLAEFVGKHPDAPGRLALQDLSVVLKQIVSLDERIERMPYDLYTEQPLKGKLP